MGIIVPGNGGIWYHSGGRYRFSAPTPDLPDTLFPGQPYHGKWRGWCDGCQRVRFRKQMERTRDIVKYCYECLQKRRDDGVCSKCGQSRYTFNWYPRRHDTTPTPYVCAACHGKKKHPGKDVPSYCPDCSKAKGICRRCGGSMD